MWSISELKASARAGLRDNYWRAVLSGFVAKVCAFISAYVMLWVLLSIMSGISGIVSCVLGSTEGGVLQMLPMYVGILLMSSFAIAASTLLVSPFEVGAARFFIGALHGRPALGELAHGCNNNYFSVVRTLLLRNVYLLLWGLLLVVPGIVKSYEYRMVPYLLAHEPSLTSKSAFELSSRLMDGNKGRAFLLDLSFVGWSLLSFVTLGGAGMLYVSPYRGLANAALYERIRNDVAVPPSVAQPPVEHVEYHTRPVMPYEM